MDLECPHCHRVTWAAIPAEGVAVYSGGGVYLPGWRCGGCGYSPDDDDRIEPGGGGRAL